MTKHSPTTNTVTTADTQTPEGDLPDDALPTVDASPTDDLTDEGTPRPPLSDGTDLSTDDRLSRLEGDVAELRVALMARDSEHFAHHTRLAASGYGPVE